VTAQGRKLQVIDFFKQCCLNATRGRERIVVHSPTEACRGSFGGAITPALSYDSGVPQVLLQLEALTAAPSLHKLFNHSPAARPSRRRSLRRQFDGKLRQRHAGVHGQARVLPRW
jgi:hypothetical protein